MGGARLSANDRANVGTAAGRSPAERHATTGLEARVAGQNVRNGLVGRVYPNRTNTRGIGVSAANPQPGIRGKVAEGQRPLSARKQT